MESPNRQVKLLGMWTNNIWKGMGMKLDITDFFEDFHACAELVKRIPYRAKGVFPSELLSFCTLVKKCEVGRIYESGMAMGYSTEVLAATLNVPVTTCDLAGYGPIRYWGTRIRLAKYRQISVHRGNSKKLLPELIGAKGQGEVIGLIIDGPKDQAAIQLATSLVKQFRNIKVIAIHDVGGGRCTGFREMLQHLGWSGFVTDEDWFRESAHAVDTEIIEQSGKSIALKKYPYGPGLGIGWPESFADRFQSLA